MAWRELYRVDVASWEIRVIKKIDSILMKVSAEAAKAKAKK